MEADDLTSIPLRLQLRGAEATREVKNTRICTKPSRTRPLNSPLFKFLILSSSITPAGR